jgi:hypothetical protein
MTDKTIFAKYIGKGGAFVAGVPACDLTEAEWNACAEDARQLALEAGTHKLMKSGKAAEVNHGATS